MPKFVSVAQEEQETSAEHLQTMVALSPAVAWHANRFRTHHPLLHRQRVQQHGEHFNSQTD